MHITNEHQALAQALGRPASELGGLSRLTAEQLIALRAHLDSTRKRQRDGMESAIQNALGHLPSLLRGPVIKILRG